MWIFLVERKPYNFEIFSMNRNGCKSFFELLILSLRLTYKSKYKKLVNLNHQIYSEIPPS